MNRKLIITEYHDTTVTAVMENEEIVELHCSKRTEREKPALGNIYVGRVKNIVSNIHAAFIEIAAGMECYYAIEQNTKPVFTKKIGKKPLCIGDELLVQIQKEAVKTKVPTVTANISLTGKYVVLTSGNAKAGVSTKLSKATRVAFLELVKPYCCKEYGFIVRTNAKDAKTECILQEIEKLIQEYEILRKVADTRTCFSCLREAPASYITDLRDIYQEGLTEIIVEGEGLFEQVEEYLSTEQPEDLSKLRKYEDSLLPLYKLYSIEHVMEEAMREKVWLKSGAYLVIQPTEALTVIDVNTGKCIKKKKNEEAYLQINLEAAKEAAKQIRLRNLSGIILIDFINLKSKEELDKLQSALCELLRKDSIPTTFIDITPLQLVEITRKKVRKPLRETLKGV